MDGHRFDEIARTIAHGAPSRRGLLRGVVAALAAGFAGGRGAAAVVCRMPGETCDDNAICCSGLCGPKDATGRHRCLCQSAADCPAPRRCRAATCLSGVCGTRITAGAPCDDGNLCTTGDVCGEDGGCRGTPVTCPPIDLCHLAGFCDRRTGDCVDGPPVVCVALDQCHAAGTCDLGTGACSNPQLPDETACALPGGGSGHCCGGVCRECCADGDCGTGRTCSGGTCVCDPATCAGCCAGNACVGGNDSDACGHGGVTCAVCQSPQTCGGGGTAGICGCTPTCQQGFCNVSDGCGGTCHCPTCQHCSGNFCAADQDHTSCGEGLLCSSGTCTPCIPDGTILGNGCVGDIGGLCCSGGCTSGPDFARCCHLHDGILCCVFDSDGNPLC
jgi:hypothetical protein